MPTETPDEVVDRHINLKLALQNKSTGELKEIILLQADRIILYRAQLNNLVEMIERISKTL